MQISIEDSPIFEIEPTGSFYICDPPVTDTDRDYIVLASSDADEYLISHGWSRGRSRIFERRAKGEISSDFMSYRKENLNYIVTNSREFFNKFKQATRIAKKLNLLKKEDRIVLFEEILYNKEYNG